MPELRSGPRRGRAAAVGRKGPQPANKNVDVKTRAAPVKGRPRTRLAAKELQVQEPPIVIISVADSHTEGAEENKIKEEGGAGVMGGHESGGLSPNKVVVPEDEGNTPPIPDKVYDYLLFVQNEYFSAIYLLFEWTLNLRMIFQLQRFK